MTRLHPALFSLMLLTALFVGCSSPWKSAEPLGRSVPVPILEHYQGSDAAIHQMGQWLFNSQQEVDAIGSVQLARLNVDFEHQSLVVLALGEQPSGGYAVEITGLSKLDNELYVQGVAQHPGDTELVSSAFTYPYAAAIIAKTEAAVIHPEIESR